MIKKNQQQKSQKLKYCLGRRQISTKKGDIIWEGVYEETLKLFIAESIAVLLKLYQTAQFPHPF